MAAAHRPTDQSRSSHAHPLPQFPAIWVIPPVLLHWSLFRLSHEP
jgi:hypothetical protein